MRAFSFGGRRRDARDRLRCDAQRGQAAAPLPATRACRWYSTIDGDAFGTVFGCAGLLVGFFVEASRQGQDGLDRHRDS
jgi:hypothetical protein